MALDKTLRPDFEGRRHFAKSLFGGGGGGSSQLMQALQLQQIAAQQQAIRDSQGQQLALTSKEQAKSDNEAASLQKPGIGRALLSYKQNTSQTLGG